MWGGSWKTGKPPQTTHLQSARESNLQPSCREATVSFVSFCLLHLIQLFILFTDISRHFPAVSSFEHFFLFGDLHTHTFYFEAFPRSPLATPASLPLPPHPLNLPSTLLLPPPLAARLPRINAAAGSSCRRKSCFVSSLDAAAAAAAMRPNSL